ncbi:MAG: outer membrane beta-barrel protein [Flavobacteriales bacterium]|nr:outer membrane beta-barrel protein [Flavobacteriales bacterium]
MPDIKVCLYQKLRIQTNLVTPNSNKMISKKNLRRVIASSGMMCIMSLSFGQAFETGNSNIQIGYGFGNFVQAIFKTYETTYDEFKFKGTGPLFFKYEYAVNDKIGIGLNVAYIGAEVSYTDKDHITSNGEFYKETIKWSNISALARMNLHFGDNDKFDPYWGFGLGYRTGNTTYDDNDPDYDNSASLKSYIPFGFETTLGARYFFSDNFGLYAETGLAKAVFQVGLDIKF